MKELKAPKREELDKLEKVVEFNPDEQVYWDNMKNCIDSQFDKDDYKGKIEFYRRELVHTKGKFGNRIAVERRLKYKIGHAYEWLGTYGLEGHDPKERANMFEKAVLWYQSADEIVGFLTDYALRQSEACAGATKFRIKAGLEDEVTDWFRQRSHKLLRDVLGHDNFIVVGGEIPKAVKQMADEKIDSVVKAYFLRDHSQDYKQN